MGSHSFESNELRSIIRGECTWKKCPDCHGNGIVYFKWNSPSQESSTDITLEEYNPNDELHGDEPCRLCDGVGYKFVCWDD